MKKLTYLLAVLLSTGLTSAAIAQTSPKSQAPKTPAQVLRDSQPDYYMMQDGHMMMRMKGGQTQPMTANMTMSNGSMLMTDGTCKMKDGTTMAMKDGQCMMMNGKMTTKDAMKKGHKMKHSSKTTTMKM